jgi:hypothetical protein
MTFFWVNIVALFFGENIFFNHNIGPRKVEGHHERDDLHVRGRVLRHHADLLGVDQVPGIDSIKLHLGQKTFR